MRNRKENTTLSTDFSEVESAIKNLLGALNHKIINDTASIQDIELLVNAIIESIHAKTSLSDRQKFKKIGKIAMEYSPVLSFLIQNCTRACRDKIFPFDDENFLFHCRIALIEPMILKLADTTEHVFISPWFGKIPLISLFAEGNHSLKALMHINDDLAEKNIKKIDQQELGLTPYIKTFGLLNMRSASILTPETEKSLFQYFLETAQLPLKMKKPQLIFAAADLLQIFQAPSRIQNRLESITLRDQKIILISIDQKLSFQQIIKNIFYELQHLFNSYFFQKHNASLSGFSQDAIVEFIEFISNFSDIDPLYSNISLDIRKLLSILYPHPETWNTDEISALLTVVLMDYSDTYVRAFFTYIFYILSDASSENNAAKEKCLIICNTLSNALLYIEDTLQHLTLALYYFNANLTYEFMNMQFDGLRISEIKLLAKNMMESKLKNVTSQELMQANNKLMQQGSSLLQKPNDPANSLFAYVKNGHYERLQALLQICAQQINDINKKGYSLLAYAVLYNQAAIFDLLLQFGANIDWKSTKGEIKNTTLLHLACMYGSFELIPVLIRYGLSVSSLDSKKNTPLLLLAKYIDESDKYEDVLQKLKRKDFYQSSIKAFAFLLSYSGQHMTSEHNKSYFYVSLFQFRKYIALLYLLHYTNALNKHVSREIIPRIAMYLDKNIPCKMYKNFYMDIGTMLFSNEILFHGFINLGLRTVYTDFRENVLNEPRLFKNLLGSFTGSDPIIDNDDSLSVSENMQLIQYYTPRTIHSGITSIVAVTLAQLHPCHRYSIFAEKRYKNRKMAIESWRKKVENKEDEGLIQSLFNVCNILHITEINNEIYHKLSVVLHQLVILEKKTPHNYIPESFEKQMVSGYAQLMK